MNNSDSTLISKLYLILIEDIKVIKDLESNCKKNPELSSFLKSLISTKKTILNLLKPVENDISDIPSPPTSNNVIGYKLEKINDNNLSIVRMIYDVENTQFNFVKKNMMRNNMTDQLKKRWSNVLTIYVKTTDQIGRIINTNALNPLTI